MMFEVNIEKPVSVEECKKVFAETLGFDADQVFDDFSVDGNSERPESFLNVGYSDSAGDYKSLITLDQYPFEQPLDLFPHGPKLAKEFNCRIAMVGAFDSDKYIIFDPSGVEFVAYEEYEPTFRLTIAEGPLSPKQRTLFDPLNGQ